jgi:putative polyketide hydroxylase
VRSLRIRLDYLPLSDAAGGAAFGIGSDGASLVRPDGYIAWRSRDLPADPTTALVAALAHVAAISTAETHA